MITSQREPLKNRYSIRDVKVMLDRDLVELYGVETRNLIQAVKRNTDGFPQDFMFQLNQDEFSSLRSQIVISKGKGGRRYPPYAFSLTPQARKLWEAIPGEVRVKLLNNVWCGSCRKTTGICEVTGSVEKGALVLKGQCTTCGGRVTRLIESI